MSWRIDNPQNVRFEEETSDTHSHDRPHTEESIIQPGAQPEAQAQTQAQAGALKVRDPEEVRRSVDLLNNAAISRANSVRFAMDEEHPLFGDAVGKADLEDLEELEERSLTLIEGRRMSVANASVSYQDDQAGRASRRSLAGIVIDADAPAERSMRDYSIERRSIVEPGNPVPECLGRRGCRSTQRESLVMARYWRMRPC
ncbi:hypothetical protein M758_5G172000 [Ceratodon purpureus]|nr:hypothetical protein M758_5G172000 [Ceratodon purpureus]